MPILEFPSKRQGIHWESHLVNCMFQIIVWRYYKSRSCRSKRKAVPFILLHSKKEYTLVQGLSPYLDLILCKPILVVPFWSLQHVLISWYCMFVSKERTVSCSVFSPHQISNLLLILLNSTRKNLTRQTNYLASTCGWSLSMTRTLKESLRKCDFCHFLDTT